MHHRGEMSKINQALVKDWVQTEDGTPEWVSHRWWLLGTIEAMEKYMGMGAT